MNRLLLAALLASAAFAASAQSVGTATQPTVQDDLRSDVATRDVRDHSCLRETGSLISTAQNQRALRRARANHEASVDVHCAGYGRAYTQDDIRSSGGRDLAESLRLLSPSIH